MARQSRQTASQIVPHGRGSNRVRATGEIQGAPYKGGGRGCTALILQAARGSAKRAVAAKALIAAAGSVEAHNLRPFHVAEAFHCWDGKAQSTRQGYHGALRQLLEILEASGTPSGLATTVQRIVTPSPRSLIATDAEVLALLGTSTPAWFRWVLMSSVLLGIRSGTGRTVQLSAYDARRATLNMRTKFDRAVELPVPPAMAEMLKPLAGEKPHLAIASLLHRNRVAITAQKMQRPWASLKRRAGVNPALRLHDLRRTLAVNVYDYTKDLRAVQAVLGHRNLHSTLLYLDHHTTPVPSTLLHMLASERVQ